MRTKRLLVTVLLLLCCTECLAEDASSLKVLELRGDTLIAAIPVITEAGDVKNHVGQIVAVRGVVSDTKRAQILNVEIGAASDLRNKEGYAVGVLQRFAVAQVNPAMAYDGAGIKFALYADLSGKLAEARALPAIGRKEQPPREPK
jgi:hypothetical protein